MYIKEKNIEWKRIKFTKMHWAWNDFIIIRDYRLKEAWIELTTDFITKICDRHFWIGSDGLLLISANDEKIKYIIYNPDWTRVEMCGNWIRCFMKYLHEKKITTKETLDIETDNWVLTLTYKDDLVTVDMWNPTKIKSLTYDCKNLWDVFLIKAKSTTFKFIPISMWNPHAVIYLKSHAVNEYDIHKYWSLIENSIDIFKEKTNVEFVNVVSSREVNMRVWERWVWETLACGTWACATIVAGILAWYLEKDDFIKLNLKWWTLYVKWSWDITDSVILRWEAEIVSEGEYFIK